TGSLSAPANAQGLGTNYCTAAPNSTGVGAVMYAGGSQDVDDNNLTLTAGLVPRGRWAPSSTVRIRTWCPLAMGRL
ncbi:MAG: hypothetical protein QF615_04030, partial [Planctomycetota bacterium]|nr:hypothetical protein [Planctomycetota bacterium]